MKIIVDGKNAFVHVRGNTFLCIGEKKAVLKADYITQAQMVMVAIAQSDYNDIKKGEGHRIH